MIVPPATDYFRAFALTFVAGLISGWATTAFGKWQYQRGLARSQ